MTDLTDTAKKESAKRTQASRAKAQTMSDIMQKKKPNQKTCRVLLNPELARPIELKMNELRIAKANEAHSGRSLADKSLLKIAQELEELITAAEPHYAEFTFQDIGRKKYDDLVLASPPTLAQKKIWETETGGKKGNLSWNYEIFPPALISMASHSPKISLEQAQLIYGVSDEDPEGNEAWGEGDLQLLLDTAIEVCKEMTSIPLSRRGIETITSSPSNSTSPLNGESLTPNS